MEFINLSKHYNIINGVIPPFSKLRTMKPIITSQQLDILNNENDDSYIKWLIDKKIIVVPIRRVSLGNNFIHRIEFPRRILFEMTNRCNYQCKMCPRQKMTRPEMDMPADSYCRIIDEIEEYGIEGLWLYHLGESFLHPEFKKIVEYISTKKKLGTIWMSTNGILFHEKNINFVIKKSNIDYINISVHAVTKKTYNKVIPTGNFDIVQKNLMKFYEIKGSNHAYKRPLLHCQMIEQETTKHEVDGFIKMHYNKADIVSINMLEYINIGNNSFGIVQRKRKPLTSCTRVTRNDCFIFSNGDVTLCDAAFNAEICLGNINEKSLYEIWNDIERKRILELNEKGNMFKNHFCRQCTDYDI